MCVCVCVYIYISHKMKGKQIQVYLSFMKKEIRNTQCIIILGKYKTIMFFSSIKISCAFIYKIYYTGFIITIILSQS